MSNKVRIAISPVGPIALNDIRAALFNVAFARRFGGNVLLRFLDVAPASKSVAARSESVVIEALAWLGLHHTLGPLRQSDRLQRYRDVALQLLGAGKAFPCFCSLAEMQARCQSGRYDRKCFFLPPDVVRSRLALGHEYRIRLISPVEGEGMFVDAVRGSVKWQHADMDDKVLLTPQGSPTYDFTAVVDNHDDQLTHVIQGDEWLLSACRQVTICHALGWEPPTFAHLPMLLTEHGADSLLSRQESYAQLQTYRNAGTHPDALLNYLAWPTFMFDDQRQKFTLAELAQHFDFGRIGKMQPQLDTARLTWLQEQYSR